jgi:hypothetical protein
MRHFRGLTEGQPTSGRLYHGDVGAPAGRSTGRSVRLRQQPGDALGHLGAHAFIQLPSYIAS